MQTFCNLEDLNRLMGGAVQERWKDALDRLARNVFDPNTDPRKKRKITLVLTVTPNERRDGGEMTFDVRESFAPPVPVSQTIFFERAGDGSVYATQRQSQLPGQVDMAGEVTPEPARMELSPAQGEGGQETTQGGGANVLSFK